MSAIQFAMLCAIAGTFLTVCFGPSLLCLKRPHRYGPWKLVSIKYEQRFCQRCLHPETRKDVFWARITAPASAPHGRGTAPTAPTVPDMSASCGTGTAEIPRLTSGVLSSMPTPPRVAGVGHVVLDHE